MQDTGRRREIYKDRWRSKRGEDTPRTTSGGGERLKDGDYREGGDRRWRRERKEHRESKRY